MSTITMNKTDFFEALKERSAWVNDVFHQSHYQESFRPEVLRQAVYSYLERPAKRFRPGILLFTCGAVGGVESQAVLAAAAVEVYHTWTLVHDDIIDNDAKRRGCPTVHEEFRLKALEWGYQEQEAIGLGRSVAILAGDLQHAWAVRLMLDSQSLGVPLPVVAELVARMENELTNGLVTGEALDVLYGKRRINEITEAEILEMLALKTGVLYEYAAMVGAAIGFACQVHENLMIEAIGRFARKCGTAFQLQDDILGIVGDEKILGKAVGSDLREGKRTVILHHAYQQASAEERIFLEKWLANPAATEVELDKLKEILVQNGGITYTQKLAQSIVEEALVEIAPLKDSFYKEALIAWSRYVIEREV